MLAEFTGDVADAPMLAAVERECAHRFLQDYEGENWARWLIELFPAYFMDVEAEFIRFAPFHERFWRHVWEVDLYQKPDPFCGIWPRDTGKSTNGEMAVVYLGGEQKRRYAFYVSGTQSQADDHVSNAAALLESASIAEQYPRMSERLLSKFGFSKGWRVNRLRCGNGFTVDAIGLDRAVRGARLEYVRPDLMIFDDVDDVEDSLRTIQKKIRTITRDLLPAGSRTLMVLFLQNLQTSRSIAYKLAHGEADFLANRIVDGPHPAIRNLTYVKHGRNITVTGGDAVWEGYNLAHAQAAILQDGLPAFLAEVQNDTRSAEGNFLGDVWKESVHIIRPFVVPVSWRVDRSFDWGLSKPYACIWWAESDGSPYRTFDDIEHFAPRGTLFGILEEYGCKDPNVGVRLSPDVVSRIILQRQSKAPWAGRVRPGPADPSIFSSEDGVYPIGEQMSDASCGWEKGSNAAGIRAAGGSRILGMLEAAVEGALDKPHLYFFDSCKHIARTFPDLPKDPANADDVDTDAEDHLWDATRQRVTFKRKLARRARVRAG